MLSDEPKVTELVGDKLDLKILYWQVLEQTKLNCSVGHADPIAEFCFPVLTTPHLGV